MLRSHAYAYDIIIIYIYYSIPRVGHIILSSRTAGVYADINVINTSFEYVLIHIPVGIL